MPPGGQQQLRPVLAASCFRERVHNFCKKEEYEETKALPLLPR